MRFNIKNCIVKIDYSFILVLSFAAILKSGGVGETLLYSSFHELGHLIVLLLCGEKPVCVNLSYYGFGIKYDQKISPCAECAVLAAGPITNLILYFAFDSEISLILFLFNILPIYPLDGGRILRIWFERGSRVISALTLCAVCAFTVFMIIYKHNFSLIPVCVYLIFYSLNYDG